MFIEEVIIDGFKSYASRTVISGWDPSFNAITGLNGSGKSNILDAICFVLGIDNLRQVRATTLQDLIYKRGQAGITKASVSIVFDNSDPRHSPVGYADSPRITVTRQIVLEGGKNRYLINGHNALQRNVENLFQSVQLNVNNPHFLIMQGQITRVLNMRPPEILGMIEESAGTRMFEDRKGKALSTMTKKEAKIAEIHSLISATIDPKLALLRTERSALLEFQRMEAELQQLQRVTIAHQYWKQNEQLLLAQNKRNDAVLLLESHVQEKRNLQRQLETAQDSAVNVRKLRDKEAAGNHIVQLEAMEKETERDMVTLQTRVDLERRQLEEDRSLAEELQGRREQLDRSVKECDQNLQEHTTKCEALEEEDSACASQIQEMNDLVCSLQTGLAVRSTQDQGQQDGEIGFARLLRVARDNVSSLEVQVSQKELRLKTIKEELAQMDAACQQASVSGAKDRERRAQLESEVNSLQMELSASTPASSDQSTLQLKRSSISAELEKTRRESESLRNLVRSTNFSHAAHPEIDDQKVCGMVAELVRINSSEGEEHVKRVGPALEVVAGGRLYNVVVREERTAAALLKHGRLARRVTFIPLDTIRPRVIPTQSVKLAEELTDGAATSALSLISHDGDLRAAMEYVFGSSFVCDSKDAATLVAFDRRLGFRAVTVDGDVYEPSGTLTGGSSPSNATNNGLLVQLAQYQRLEKRMDDLTVELEAIDTQLAAEQGARRNVADQERLLKAKQQELSLLQRRYELDASGKLLMRQESLKSEFELVTNALLELKQQLKNALVECKRLEKEQSEFAADRAGKLKELQGRISQLEKKRAGHGKTLKTVKDKQRKAQSEHDAATAQLAAIDQELTSHGEKLKLAEESLQVIQEQCLAAVTKHTGVRVQLVQESEHLRAFTEQLERLEAEVADCREALESMQLESEQLERSISSLDAELEKCAQIMQTLTKEHVWIEDEAASFGVTGSAFDFANLDMKSAERRVAQLKEACEQGRRRVNFHVMDMIDRVEAKDVSLRRMLDTVQKDRSKISGTIETLNTYKLEALERTWTKVNEDFGAIFGELLPGSSARLDPLEGGRHISEGLEIKVRLGSVWKTGLAELSGGQRSLVALSLILALLQFKPAPMYILDEVDAALDLSHTENIGRLLRHRFAQSQFIVVSLKEGMFANANVLFRTQFRDGISHVHRIARSDEDATAAADISEAKLKNIPAAAAARRTASTRVAN